MTPMFGGDALWTYSDATGIAPKLQFTVGMDLAVQSPHVLGVYFVSVIHNGVRPGSSAPGMVFTAHVAQCVATRVTVVLGGRTLADVTGNRPHKLRVRHLKLSKLIHELVRYRWVSIA